MYTFSSVGGYMTTSLSCHARKINSLHYKRMTLADCMRSALLIYQKFVLLLIITLLLIKYDNVDDIKIENLL
uniref:Uncharacterized protein n=1 Tax=Glossina palpalis gambiensis TaxID=67801 RepID=A0A1B0C5E7_9MUSC